MQLHDWAGDPTANDSRPKVTWIAGFFDPQPFLISKIICMIYLEVESARLDELLLLLLETLLSSAPHKAVGLNPPLQRLQRIDKLVVGVPHVADMFVSKDSEPVFWVSVGKSGAEEIFQHAAMETDDVLAALQQLVAQTQRLANGLPPVVNFAEEMQAAQLQQRGTARPVLRARAAATTWHGAASVARGTCA